MATAQKRITKRMLFAKTIEILQPKLGLGDWKLVVRYSRRMKNTLADCTASPEYKHAIIRLNLSKLNDYSQYEIIQTAIHEMMHCIVWPLTQWSYDLCKTDKNKIEVTRRMDETVITQLEKTYSDIVFISLQKELKELGYGGIENLIQNIVITTDKKPATKKAVNKTKRK